MNCEMPVAWNSGAPKYVASPTRSGMRSRNSAECSGETFGRGAPFGVPVVPLVSRTNPPGLAGAGSGWSSLPAMTSSSDGTAPGSESAHAR